MNRRSILFVGPVLTSSGYGTHARQLLRALYDSDRFDIFVESIKWGNTSFLSGPEVDWIFPMVRARESVGDRRFDISVQVTIPNEFRRVARLNIGVTAGIETDRVSPTWIQKVNDEVDLLVVPSQHSRRTFVDTRYQSNDGSLLELQRPVVVIGESVPDTFFPAAVDSLIESDTKNLLVVGLGLDKPLGQDRKNISSTVLWFLREFAGREDVGLVMKVGIVNNSLLDFEHLTHRVAELRALSGVGQFPRIALIHGRRSEAEMARLYNDPKIVALVSLTHGEGFGLPLLEAAACGLPVIATSWSGHLDFLADSYIPVKHSMAEIPTSCVWDGVMERGSKWADVSEQDARAAMALALSDENAKTLRERALAHSEWVRENFSQGALQQKLVDLIDNAWDQTVSLRPETRPETVNAIRRQLSMDRDRKHGRETLLFTMPMSAGDVYLSTAVVHALRADHTDADGVGPYVIFATKPQYRSILEGNTDIDEVVDWQPWMHDTALLEDTFTHVYTPNIPIQTVWANWVHRGRGRNLFHEIAAQCSVSPESLGGPLIQRVPAANFPEHHALRYIVIHTGSGQGQWGARRYDGWQDIVDNFTRLLAAPGCPLEGVKLVQVGLPDEPALRGVIDMRGKTTDYRQLADVVARAIAVVSIDSLVMHLAAHHNVKYVSIFGGSYSSSTGPGLGAKEFPSGHVGGYTIDTPDRMGCERACYKNECAVSPDNPCINNIQAEKVLSTLAQAIIGNSYPVDGFKKGRPRMSGYTHTLNAKTHGYPFIQSIRSMLGFCDEVVVIDGGSTDGTVEDISAIGDPRVKLIANRWDPDEPGMDGIQKAFGRVMCDPASEFLWQQDCDEVVHEDDYEKITDLTRKFPAGTSLVHLPVIELWGSDREFRTDRHAWKWRLSRNDFNVTHGIASHARLIGKDGRSYAKEGMSDGCEYIDVMTGQYVPHKGFWNADLEILRHSNPNEYGKKMNDIFERLPSVFHYSWADIPRKIRNFNDFWDGCWRQLYRTEPKKRFPNAVDDESIASEADRMHRQGGEHGQSTLIALRRSTPAVMIGWIDEGKTQNPVPENDEEGRGVSQEAPDAS